jgi:hypothetical protein
MGFDKNKVEVHDQAQNLYGYQGDVRNQKANIIICRKHISSSANDIGFELQEDGTYAAHISDFDKGRFNETWRADLEMHYGIEQAKTAFANEGWSYIETVDEQNNIQLIGTRCDGDL